MTPNTLDLALVAVVGLFALLGLRSGTAAQMKLIFGLVFGALLAAPAASMGAPIVQPMFGGISPINVRMNLFCLVFFISLMVGVGLFEKIRPSGTDPDDKPSGLSRVFGLVLGGGKSAAALYALLCLAVPFDKAIGNALGPKADVVKGSAAAGFAREHSFLGKDLSPEMKQLQKLAEDPHAAATALQNDAKALVEQESKLPEPSEKAKALAQALKTGDMATLAKETKIGSVIQKAGVDKMLKPVDVDAQLKNGLPDPTQAR